MRKGFLRPAAAIIAAAVVLLSLTAAAYPEPTKDFFVNDFAGVISEEDAASMQSDGVQLYQLTKAQVVVVTVDSLDGKDIRDYGYDLANGWGIGDEELDNGVLLLLSVSDRLVDIEVGRGLEGRLNDAKTGRILDNYAVPYFKDDDFSSGLAQAYDAIVNEVYIEYGMKPYSDYDPALTEEEDDDIAFGIILFIMIILALIFSRRGRGMGFFPFLFGGMFRGGGGGGFSGGGFSGGGGSFGGGGSSRGF